MNIDLPNEDSKTIDIEVKREQVCFSLILKTVYLFANVGSAILPSVQMQGILEQGSQVWPGQGRVGLQEVLPQDYCSSGVHFESVEILNQVKSYC